MNALPAQACFEMDKLWTWFDDEPELLVHVCSDPGTQQLMQYDRRVGIITGAGKKAFCAGMDLKGGSARIISGKSF